MSKLEDVKSKEWFYEFSLPDGTKTTSYLPEEVRSIQTTRGRVLRDFLRGLSTPHNSALDVSCHEGYFSLILSEFFDDVTGIDKNQESLSKAREISDLLNGQKVKYVHSKLEDCSDELEADFVLCYGLLYHVENPVEMIRRLSNLTSKTLCIESQVLPVETSGKIEDGSYKWQRDINGTFGLCVDYSGRPEGGSTDIAIVPSRNALEFLLYHFGFSSVNFYQPNSDDYEQFTRQQRVIIFAEK